MSDGQGSGAKAPMHLWIVGLLGVLWNGFGCVNYVMTAKRDEEWLANMEATPEMLAYMETIPAWAMACWAMAVFGALFGSLALLARKRVAVTLFLISFVAMLGTNLNSYVLTDGAEAMGEDSWIISAVIFVIALFLLFYAKAQARKGVLS